MTIEVVNNTIISSAITSINILLAVTNIGMLTIDCFNEHNGMSLFTNPWIS
jgi:hypothetical protein